jgi:hypothetical protein
MRSFSHNMPERQRRTAIFVAAILGLGYFVVAGGCDRQRLVPADWAVSSVTINGPEEIQSNGAADYSVTVEITRADDPPREIQGNIRVFDDDRDVLVRFDDQEELARLLVKFPPGVRSQTQSITLACLAPAAGIVPVLVPFAVSGNYGSSFEGTAADPAEVYAFFINRRSDTTINVTCSAPPETGATELGGRCSRRADCREGLVCNIGANTCQELCGPPCFIDAENTCQLDTIDFTSGTLLRKHCPF